MPQTLAMPPPPQTPPALVHEPQLMMLPQVSFTSPQLKPRSWHVFGVHVGAPHMPATLPPPQV
jgi:hypothetical protein